MHVMLMKVGEGYTRNGRLSFLPPWRILSYNSKSNFAFPWMYIIVLSHSHPWPCEVLTGSILPHICFYVMYIFRASIPRDLFQGSYTLFVYLINSPADTVEKQTKTQTKTQYLPFWVWIGFWGATQFLAAAATARTWTQSMLSLPLAEEILQSLRDL